MAPIPVLYVADALHDAASGGSERQLTYLLSHLDRRRVAPRLAVFRSTPFTSASETPCPVEVLRIGSVRRPSAGLRLLQLAAAVRARGVRVVHVFFNDASIVVPPLCRAAGAQVVVSRRDMGFWYTPGTLRLLRAANRFVCRMVVNSEAVRQNVHERERYPLDRTDVLPNGIDTARAEAPPLAGFREAHRIGANDPVIGMVAHFHPWKRQGDVVEAFRAVLPAHPNAHLVFAGAGACEAQVAAMCTGALRDRVHFLGAVPDALPIVRHFTAGVLCSDSEGLSNAVLEYLSCGIPVVCTTVGGNRELVSDGVDGFLVAPGDVASLTDRLARLLGDPARAMAMGARARQTAGRFSLTAMVERHTTLYESLAGGARPC